MAVSPDQLNAAFMYCFEFAKQMLNDSGAFYPFGATISDSGQVEAAGASNGDEKPNPAEIYGILLNAFRCRAESAEIGAAAIAVDVNIPLTYQPTWSDGIRVQLESVGYARYIYVPYSIKMVGLLKRKREVSFAEPFSVEIDPEIFRV